MLSTKPIRLAYCDYIAHLISTELKELDTHGQKLLAAVGRVQFDLGHHDEFIMEIGKESFKEFSQHHIDEVIVSSRELSAKDYLKLFDTDNDYCKNWDIADKMKSINSIDYKE